MASTYVNDLRLNEMATGDGSGTWGTTTNTNLELIAEAFSYGTEGITTNADTHTSTIADGATDPVRSMYVKYTGTLDSACTITIAPNTVCRMQFIENGTSGSQNIIISQGSGANVTIPAGDVKAVYLDGAGSGAAVVDAFASLNVVDLKVEDDLTVTDDLIVNGDIDLEGAIDVNGTANLDVVDIDGAVDMASTLQVDGAITTSAGATFTTADNLAQLTLVSTDTDANIGPILDLKRNPNEAGADDDWLGQIHFTGHNDAGTPEDIVYAKVTGQIDDASDGSEDATVRWYIMQGGTRRESLSLGPSLTVINEAGVDKDFRVESDGNANMIFVDGGTNKVSIGSATANKIFNLTDPDEGGEALKLHFEAANSTDKWGIYAYDRTNSHYANMSLGQNAIFIQGSDTHVGIGDTSPASRLTVSDPGDGNTPTMHVIDTSDTEVAWFEGNRAGDTGAFISIYHNPSSPAETNRAGIRFQGDDDGGNKTNYAIIRNAIEDNTNGTEDGRLLTEIMHNGSVTERLRIDSDGDQKLTGATDLYFDLFADSGTGQGSGSIRFYSDGSSAEQNLASILMQQESGGGSSQKGEMYFKVSDNGAPATAIKIANNKDTECFGRLASYYDADNHVAIRGLSGGQYIQFSSQGALSFVQVDTYPNSSATEIVRMQSSGFSIGSGAIASHGDQMLRVIGDKNGYAMYLNNSRSTINQPQGILIDTSNVSSDNNSQVFLKCDDSSAARMQVFTDGDVWTSDAGTLSSDETLKTNIADATDKLSDIMNLKVRNFKWKTDYHPVKQHKHIGFIAQEFETVFPALVVENNIARHDETPNMKKGIKQGGLIPILVKSIQELKTELDAAKARITALES